jgi:DNA invertase Pin-like site-specific DNA recombinase
MLRTAFDWFYDAAVTGYDDLADRPGFSAMLDRIEGNGVRVVLVEDASRFARKVLTQELGIVALQTRGVTVWAARGDMNLTETDDEFKVAMRQMAAVFAELEKKRLVKKLKQARDRKRAQGIKVEGRKNYAERDPEAVVLARRLHRYPKKGHKLSLRGIAAELAQRGFLAASGKPYGAGAIARMLKRGGQGPGDSCGR